MKEMNYGFGNQWPTVFVQTEDRVELGRLFGLVCGLAGKDGGPAAGRGLVLADTSLGRYEGDDWKLMEGDFRAEDGPAGGNDPLPDGRGSLREGTVRLSWRTSDDALRIDSRWEYCRATGVWRRRDTLTNASSREVTVFKFLSRFSFTPGPYEFYSQESRWSNENQGEWWSINHGSRILRCEQARTCLGGTPYVFMRDRDRGRGLAFHIVPVGNWTIRVSAQPLGNDCPAMTVVELGQSVENLKFRLAPGSSLAGPEILVQAGPEGEPHRAAPRLHRYVLKNYFASAKPVAPLVYNTWFDRFDSLDVDHLRRQLAAAKEFGCEVFTIDAGWYGPEKGDWWGQTGDWREKVDGAFRGRMKAFADEVRAAGLGFGIWMEPERARGIVPAVKDHPEWFIEGPGENYYPNLTDPQARAYIFSEICRLVETYGLAWMKIDFNNHLGIDPSGTEFDGYYRAWYEIMAQLKAKYPNTFFEGCASGGMRLDINTLVHCDGHFLSDTVYPIDTLRIFQGAALRLPPGRFTLWAVLRTAGKTIPQYGKAGDDVLESAATPVGATWELTEIADPDFVVRTCMMSMLGFSGDPGSLGPELRQKLKRAGEFYKTWREFTAGAYCHLLTPPKSVEDRTGWVAFQLRHPDRPESLVFAYRLDDQVDTNWFGLYELEPDQRYEVGDVDKPEKQVVSGSELMDIGLKVQLPARNRAAVFEIRPRI
jgi:alpha-galactosidase